MPKSSIEAAEKKPGRSDGKGRSFYILSSYEPGAVSYLKGELAPCAARFASATEIEVHRSCQAGVRVVVIQIADDLTNSSERNVEVKPFSISILKNCDVDFPLISDWN